MPSGPALWVGPCSLLLLLLHALLYPNHRWSLYHNSHYSSKEERTYPLSFSPFWVLNLVGNPSRPHFCLPRFGCKIRSLISCDLRLWGLGLDWPGLALREKQANVFSISISHSLLLIVLGQIVMTEWGYIRHDQRVLPFDYERGHVDVAWRIGRRR